MRLYYDYNLMSVCCEVITDTNKVEVFFTTILVSVVGSVQSTPFSPFYAIYAPTYPGFLMMFRGSRTHSGLFLVLNFL